MSDIHPQKITKAINRIQKALDACAEAQLQFQQVKCAELKKGDYVIINGVLDKIVATQRGGVGVVALEDSGEIMQLVPTDEFLVLRPS